MSDNLSAPVDSKILIYQPQAFFATMQNKMHCAASGMTAAEIVRNRADAGKANMGLKQVQSNARWRNRENIRTNTGG